MIRKLGERDIEAFRDLRIQGILEFPQYFGAGVIDERKDDRKGYLNGFGIGSPNNFVLGDFRDGALVGVVGLRRNGIANLRHKGVVWGMYVAPEYRGTGVANRLLGKCIARASGMKGMEILNLTVETNNRNAIRLYQKFGFKKVRKRNRRVKDRPEAF